jgi:hypothetical protein
VPEIMPPTGSPTEQFLRADAWPDDGQHLYGAWYADTPQQGKRRPTQYRQCVHPLCDHVERREAPRG